MIKELFAGYRLQENDNLTVLCNEGRTLTWAERLFSWPWRPWIAITNRKYTIPSRKIIVFEEQKVIVAHPEVIRKLRGILQQVQANEEERRLERLMTPLHYDAIFNREWF